MSLLSSIKKIGRAIDPTNKSAPFGSLVAGAISVVPGGGAALAAVNTASALKPKAAPKPAPAPLAQPVPVPSVADKWSSFATSSAGKMVGIGAAVALVAWLFLRRK